MMRDWLTSASFIKRAFSIFVHHGVVSLIVNVAFAVVWFCYIAFF